MPLYAIILHLDTSVAWMISIICCLWWYDMQSYVAYAHYDAHIDIVHYKLPPPHNCWLPLCLAWDVHTQDFRGQQKRPSKSPLNFKEAEQANQELYVKAMGQWVLTELEISRNFRAATPLFQVEATTEGCRRSGPWTAPCGLVTRWHRNWGV